MTKLKVCLYNLNIDKSSGVGTYTRGLVRELCKNKSLDIYLVTCKDSAFIFKGEDLNIINVSNFFRNFYFKIILENLIIPFYIKYYKFQLFHGLDYSIPILLKPCKFFSSIHDLSVNTIYDERNFVKKYILNILIKYYIRNSDKVFTLTNFTKSQIEEKFGSLDIIVTYCGIDEFIYNLPNNSKKIIPCKNEYIVYYGGYRKNKNIEFLLTTFKSVKDKHNLDLVLIGVNSLYQKKVIHLLEKFRLLNNVHILGYQNVPSIINILRNSKLFIYPSLIEGFGLPLAEAMSLGTLILSSDGSSLKEVGGSGVVYFENNNIESCLAKTEEILGNYSKYMVYKNRAVEHSQIFRWKNVAEVIANEYIKSLR